MPTRSASAEWKGGLKGQGTYKGQTGLAGQYNFTSRFEEGMTGSNPEELLAAADAACFSMALAFALAKEGHEATSVQTTADCSIEKQGEGWKITRMVLRSRVAASGVDPAKFQSIAQATKEGCPVSTALKGNVQIELDAQLV
ncbi:MAG TPA: OsmC family peroxiredoxin [Gemmatimonadaceae bacterium]|nr:OsmC family peroxiredoxin [Gemmatimonadaceae bacterium]